MIPDTNRFSKVTFTVDFINAKKLAWKPVEALIAHIAVEDTKLPSGGRVTAIVRFNANWFGIIRAIFDGMGWEVMPRAANDEGALAIVKKGLHPLEAEHMEIEQFFEMRHDWVCQRCGSGDSDTTDVIPTEVRIGVKLKFSATLCGACSNALVSLVRPFLKEVPLDDQGPRSIIV